ncbi:hypothetical protein GCM10010390_65090 [Streptomyces mordarskii]|uniref:Uncharacterized protein n=1 Tax=Streptomyces mordarskii TaxID=1226758 RepID=A0ABP3NZI1_9ACTN
MPGCDPAGTTPAPVVGDGVIHLGDRRSTRADRQEPTVGGTLSDADSPEGRLAQTIQALYLHRARTLTDPATAEAFDIALEAALLIVDGAQARGGLRQEDHEMLRRMLETARQVPGII